MDQLASKPNLLFLAAVRYDVSTSSEIPSFIENLVWKDWSLFVKLLLITPRLRKPEIHTKFVKAVTTKYLVNKETNVSEHDIFVEAGDILYMVNGKFHCETGPAITGPNGDMYCINNRKHRIGPDGEKLPAVTFKSGQEYWVDGERHCTTGWAMHNDIGTDQEGYYWFQNGDLHRDDGAAVEFVNGGRHYYVHGKLHRVDGPALIKPITHDDPFRQEQWWNNGVRTRIGDAATTIWDVNGICERSWYVDGKKHREDGPAIEHGTQIGTPEEHLTEQHWFQNDVHHRIGGPAAIREDMYEIWLVNGKKHRTDGPAMVSVNGNDREEVWFLEDMEVTREAVEILYPLQIAPPAEETTSSLFWDYTFHKK